MKSIRNIIYTLSFLCAGMVAVSCYDDALKVNLEELGMKENEYILPIENGTLEVEYYSNLPGTIHFNEEVDWARLGSTTFNGDGILNVAYDYNLEFPRMARIVFETDDQSRIDTIYIKQLGEKIPTFQLQKNNLIVYNDDASQTVQTEVDVNTNIDTDQCDITIQYSGVKDDEQPVEWVKSTTFSDSQLIVETENNPDEALRNAVITISYVNGWEETKIEKLYLTQATKENKLGTKAEFDLVRSLVNPDESTVITDDIFIEGYIVSDVKSGNVAVNTQLTDKSIDYSRTKRCAYIVSNDGRYGFLLETASVNDNSLKLNTKVQVLLKGTTLECMDEPRCYSIKDITAPMIIYAENVDASEVPSKTKYMNELTDDDLYTLVTLKDCEFPCRKGNLSPVNDGYTNLFGGHRANMFPTLIRDINGNSMYMMTNTTCPYRREGERMGYGKGTVTGILVHENYRAFIDGDNADEEKCGNIGRYQIRHQKKADIAFAQDFEDGFSALLTEYAYFKPMGGNAWGPTYGSNGEFRHTYVNPDKPEERSTISNYSFAYLGPCGGTEKTNKNGFGILIDGDEDWGKQLTGVNGGGKGIAYHNRNVAFCNGNWWDDSHNRPYAWLVKFSTKGISTDQLSLQMAVMNYGINIPTFWRIEWSETDSMDPADDGKWKLISDFYCPDKVEWTPTRPWQSIGYKPMNFVLPLEMLDKDAVYLRIYPKSKVCSGKDDLFGGEMRSDGTAWNSIDYFGIRYNK